MTTKTEALLRRQVYSLREELERERRKSHLLRLHAQLCRDKHTYFGPPCHCIVCTGTVPDFIP